MSPKYEYILVFHKLEITLFLNSRMVVMKEHVLNFENLIASIEVKVRTINNQLKTLLHFEINLKHDRRFL